MFGWFFVFVFSLEMILSLQNLSSVEFNSLYDLYSATNGPFWVYYPSNTSFPWNFSTPDVNPCADLWQGLSCKCTDECSVYRLLLHGHNLTGTIPDSIGDLEECVELDLSDNFIHSEFPNSIGNMTKLVDLIASNNFLTGNFPSSLGSIPSLEWVDFSRNFIEFIPESFYNESSQLKILSLADNLLVGSISSRVDFLQNLQSLRLDFNLLNGSIPSTIGNFKNLTDLFLTMNLLTGEIPKAIGNLETLQWLELSYNLLQSTFPPEMGNLSSLTHLLINSNYLYGNLPLSIGALTRLRYLDLVANLFSGSLPATFPNVKYLGTLLLGTNSFTGEINFLSSFYYVTEIELLRNFFQGQVSPMIFGNQNSSVQNHLQIVQFATEYNLLSGPIPFTNRTSIELYQVTGNYFTGTIPSSTDFSDVIDQMVYFSVGDNHLHGSIPEIFLSARGLTNLNVSNNLLSGSLSFTSDLKADFNQINCENNFLTGNLSPNIGNFTNLVTLTFANNYFTGTIPFTFHNLNNLNTLTVNENNFRGSMEVLLSKTLPTNLTTIDLANNEFTGSIPTDFFLNKSANLETFIALSNCLTGSLPDGICHATKLVNLVLDGLSTAENCRIQLFNNIPFANSFTLRNTIEGSVPTCVYSMLFLMTLHLSGNGLTGSIPDSLNISSSLTDVTLSHNNLVGTVPDSFQQKYWWNLDLSYNKIAGTLSSSSFSGLNSINSSLSLEVNRLSGEVPSALLDLESISILNGNIFECNLQGSNLPVHDPDYNSYSCGSDSVNDVLYLWLVIISTIVILLVVIYIHRNKQSENENLDSTHRRVKKVVLELHLYYRKIAEYSQHNPLSNIAKLHFCFKNLRKTIIILSSVLLFVFIPAYVILTTFYQSYDVEYVWNVSAVLLSSSTAALILFILFLLFSAVIYLILLRRLSLLKDAEIAHVTACNDSEKNSSMNTTRRSVVETILVYSFIFFVDLAMMIVADVSYIVIVLNFGSVIITFAAIALAIFRIMTNNLLSYKSIPLIRYYFRKVLFNFRYCRTVDEEEQGIVQSFNSTDMGFLEIMTLLNILLIPIFVVLIILPDCFYSAFIQSPNITSSFDSLICEQYVGQDNTGLYCLDQTQYTSYTPPFIYSYQCSSKIIIYYVPVYLILFLFVGFIIPLKNLVIFMSVTRKIKPLKHPLEEEEGASDPLKNASQWKSFQLKLSSLITPLGLGPLVQRDVLDDDNMNLFPRTQITLQLTSYLAIIIAFGTIFPPLAAIGCWTIVIITLQEELFIGRILTENDETYHYEWYLPQLERDCRGLPSSLRLSFSWILIFSCWLFGYIIFDTWGDGSGWEEALPATLVMAVIPVFWTVCWNVVYYRKAWKEKEDNRNENKNVLENSDSQRGIQMSRASSTQVPQFASFIQNPIVNMGNITEEEY
jgi:hypothetical protein